MGRGPGAGRHLSTGRAVRGRRTGSPARSPFPPRALVLAWLGAAATACVSLPPDLVYEVAFAPRPQQLAEEDFYFDPEDSTTVFQRGGFRLKLRHLGDRQLNEEYARFTYREPNLNPFTYGRDRDLDLGYSPPRFTVFEMTVVNQTFPKVMVDPARMTLLTDRGDRFQYWSVRKRDAPNSFEAYYMERRGQGGNEEHYLQRKTRNRARVPVQAEHLRLQGGELLGKGGLRTAAPRRRRGDGESRRHRPAVRRLRRPRGNGGGVYDLRRAPARPES